MIKNEASRYFVNAHGIKEYGNPYAYLWQWLNHFFGCNVDRANKALELMVSEGWDVDEVLHLVLLWSSGQTDETFYNIMVTAYSI
jgi:hypothetical protein